MMNYPIRMSVQHAWTRGQQALVLGRRQRIHALPLRGGKLQRPSCLFDHTRAVSTLDNNKNIHIQEEQAQDTSSTATAATATASRTTWDIADASVLVRGDLPYGSREYVLVPPHITWNEVAVDKQLVLARLRAHNNILFGAAVAHANLDLREWGVPLVQAAVLDAGSNGEQVQALATLHGLCAWVQEQMIEWQAENNNGNNNTDDNKKTALLFARMTDVERQAVQAIATGVPRPGHSVVGQGTYRDGQDAWIALAKRFVDSKQGGSPECALYIHQGAHVVQMEPMAETSPAYLQSAGGVMARLFFL